MMLLEQHPKRKRLVGGYWIYLWMSGYFVIKLDNGKTIKSYEETPEWDKWKLVKEEGI